MSVEVRRCAARWLTEGISAVVVQVLESRGSAPRDAGTHMVVSATQTAGTVGGGHLELKAIEHARSILGGESGSAPPLSSQQSPQSSPPPSTPSSLHFALGPALGQCCGGAVTLGFALLDQHTMAQWPLPEPLFHLQLYGAGHVGRAIARLLATLDITAQWIDERDHEFPRELAPGLPWPDHIEAVCVDAVEDEVRAAPSGAFYLVLTHNHDLDMRITEAILRRGDFAYLGLIGSRTKRQRFMHRFAQRGLPASVLGRMTCPIGVEGIEGKAPEVIAVAVVAQILQVASASTTQN